MTDLPEPTPPELDLMKILWAEGELSTREAHDRLALDYDWAYSTTRTTMDRMVKKRLLARREFHGVHLYAPAISKPKALASMVRDFADRLLELDRGSVVSLFARSKALTRDEIDELTKLLDEEGGDA